MFEFEGDTVPGYDIQYIDSATACGSGLPVTVPGTAILGIDLHNAQAHTQDFQPTIDATEITVAGEAMTAAKSACDFEALVSWVVGTTGELPFRVFELSEPARLVIDVGHPE